MASENVIWLLPWMILKFGFIYALLLGWGTVYGLFKNRSMPDFLRDCLLILMVFVGAWYGLTTDHSVLGLLCLGLASCLSISLHGNELSKTNDMAPYGYLTSVSIITSLFILSGIMTSEM